MGATPSNVVQAAIIDPYDGNKVKHAFKKLDKDRDSRLSKAEMDEFVKVLMVVYASQPGAPPKINPAHVFAAADTGGNGKITIQEFQFYLQSNNTQLHQTQPPKPSKPRKRSTVSHAWTVLASGMTEGWNAFDYTMHDPGKFTTDPTGS
jgi:hypothetical protein